jgi:hypothetical protein
VHHRTGSFCFSPILLFPVRSAYSGETLLGEGTHLRFIADKEKFAIKGGKSNVLFFLIYYRFLSFCGILIKWNRINDKSNSKNRVLMSNFALKIKKRTEERD